MDDTLQEYQEHDPLELKAQYSGKIFRLSFDEENPELEEVADRLDGLKVDIELDRDYEKQDIHIPDIFRSAKGDVDTILTINHVNYIQDFYQDLIVGFAILDEPDTVEFRQNRILILDTINVQINIFEQPDSFYISMMGNRDLVEGVVKTIEEDFTRSGISITDISIRSRGIEKIAEGMADELLDTTFEEYPQSSIDKKRIWGRGYGDDPEYKEEKRRGQVHGHMMSTTELSDGSEKVVSISDDGLVRSYSNMSLRTYLDMLSEYVLPHVTSQSTIKEFNR